jgi:hypothetical protein
MIMTLRAVRTIMVFWAAAAVAASPAPAATGMVEMLNLTGARQAAMGETAPLYDHDPFNIEYNPAANVRQPYGRIGISHHSFIQDRQTSSLAIIFPAKGLDFGVHLRLSSVGDIEARDNTPTSEPLYTFGADDFALRVFSAFRIMDKLQGGVSVGWLMEKIDVHRGSAFAAGLGLMYHLRPDLLVHASASNVGGKVTFIDEKENLPSIYRAGANYHKDNLSVSADYVNVKSGDSHVHVGAEYLIEKALFLRAGYQTGYDSRNFSAGAGFIYRNLRVDYAFVPYSSDLGSSHRFTLTVAIR